MIAAESFGPAFSTALVGTLEVFAIGAAGFIFVRRGWLSESALQVIGQLVALLTLPCMIVSTFAARFDPKEFPGWWHYAIIGAAITLAGMGLGKLVALRHENNDEATLLVGFQNCGFFVLPMLQALLPPEQFGRASLMLFVLIIPFNASLWLAGSWLLLKKRTFDFQTIFTPPFIATVGSVIVFGLFPGIIQNMQESLLIRALFGDDFAGAKLGGDVGAVQLLGNLTVPLATLVMGGSIATSVSWPISKLQWKRAAFEVTAVKMVIYPLLGYALLRWWPGGIGDSVVLLLLMLQFAAPPAINIPVFAQQYGYPMRFIPTACLLSYIVALVTVPFFVALVMK